MVFTRRACGQRCNVGDSSRALEASRHAVQQKSTLMKSKCGGRDPGVSRPGSARAVSSVVVVPTSTDPMGILKNTQDFKAPGAVKEHTIEVRGGGRDPGVKRPGAGLGLSPARSKIFCALHWFKVCFELYPFSHGVSVCPPVYW